MIKHIAKKMARKRHRKNVQNFISKHKELEYVPFPGEPKVVLNENLTLTIFITILFAFLGFVFTFNRDFKFIAIFLMLMSALMSLGIFFPPRIALSGDNIFYRNGLFISIMARIKRSNNIPYSNVKVVQFTIDNFNNAPLVYITFVANNTSYVVCFTNFEKCLTLCAFFPKEIQFIDDYYS